MTNFKLKDKVKIQTTRKVAQQRPKSNCGFDKASKLFNEFLTTVSLRWPPTLQP